MKENTIAVALLCLTACTSTPTFAADPCQIVLCMYGKVTGNSGGSECRSAEKAFFSLNAFKKKGRFDPSKTSNMRKVLLGQCKTADPAAIAKIIGEFGRIRG
ncbi:conjugal transfer protein [Citrobacter sp. JGM124]|uniref:conjugal transfer protein n=1 Tax=Citrobacter sp. JGM124 TaxID=2799789 RepID=UPI001BA5C708|nr:conjugal transfer protein [Citrobacter sp. JGM124]MBS0847033.1 conjugal transfer protein [Citrobacter sp. JGM124]